MFAAFTKASRLEGLLFKSNPAAKKMVNKLSNTKESLFDWFLFFCCFYFLFLSFLASFFTNANSPFLSTPDPKQPQKRTYQLERK